MQGGTTYGYGRRSGRNRVSINVLKKSFRLLNFYNYLPRIMYTAIPIYYKDGWININEITYLDVASKATGQLWSRGQVLKVRVPYIKFGVNQKGRFQHEIKTRDSFFQPDNWVVVSNWRRRYDVTEIETTILGPEQADERDVYFKDTKIQTLEYESGQVIPVTKIFKVRQLGLGTKSPGSKIHPIMCEFRTLEQRFKGVNNVTAYCECLVQPEIV